MASVTEGNEVSRVVGPTSFAGDAMIDIGCPVVAPRGFTEGTFPKDGEA
jgi:hypothetical protein